MFTPPPSDPSDLDPVLVLFERLAVIEALALGAAITGIAAWANRAHGVATLREYAERALASRITGTLLPPGPDADAAHQRLHEALEQALSAVEEIVKPRN